MIPLSKCISPRKTESALALVKDFELFASKYERFTPNKICYDKKRGGQIITIHNLLEDDYGTLDNDPNVVYVECSSNLYPV